MNNRYDTFSPGNLLELENYIIVAQALLKMALFFWPAILVSIVWIVMAERKQGESQ
jgi:hypothetical protein